MTSAHVQTKPASFMWLFCVFLVFWAGFVLLLGLYLIFFFSLQSVAFCRIFFLFLYLGYTTANIICVLLSSYNLSVSQKSYNLNEWGNFFCSNHSIFFWKNSCICNTVHACSVFLDGHITNCHLSFIKKYKGFEHKETILKKQ